MRLCACLFALAAVGCLDVSGLSDFMVSGGGGSAPMGGSGGTPATGGSGGSGGAMSQGGGGAAGLGPFTNIQIAAGISSSGDEDDPTFTEDGLEVYFNRDDDIWMATRPALDAPWGGVVINGTLSTSDIESNPAISLDGLTIHIGTELGSPGDTDIYVATRPDRAAAWSNPQPVSELNTGLADWPGPMSADGSTILIYSTRDGDPARHYIATRPTTADTWGTPVAVGELQVGTSSLDGWWTPDTLTLFWQRDNHIWHTTRASSTDAFDVPNAEMLMELVGFGASQVDPWLTPDLRYIMFTFGDGGNRDIYEATR